MRSRIRNKIIIPYLLLALVVALIGSFAAFFIIAGSLQERLEQRLRQSALHTSQGLVDFEDQQLARLRLIALNGPNPDEGLLSTTEALRRADRTQLETILRNGRDFYQMSYLLVFDLQGTVLAEQYAHALTPYLAPLRGSSLASLAGVRYILDRRQDIVDGALADKFSSILVRQTLDGAELPMLYTVVPIRQRDPVTGQEHLLGGLLAAEPLQRVVDLLHERNGAFYTVLYNGEGQVFAVSPAGSSDDLSIPADVLQALRSQSDPERALRTVPLNRRDFLFAYSPLRIRERIDGYFGVALEVAGVFESWQPTRNAVVGLTLLLLTGVVGLGHLIARRITQPLQELAQTASVIAQGQLNERSRVRSDDEVGMLAAVLNKMADRLVDLYQASRALGAELEIAGIIRAADEAIQRLVPGAVTAAIVPDEGHWVLIFAQDRASRPLSRFDIHAAGQLPLFSEVQTLGAMLDEDLPDSFKPNWALPLRTQQDTIGLLLIAGGAHLPEAKAIREPLIAIATMTATSLYNALLYTRVEQEASKNRAILESIADGVIVCDQSGAITLANDAAGAMLGCSAAELRGLPFATLPLKPVPFSGELFSDEHAQQLYIAQNRTLSLSIAPLAISDDRQAGQVIILHDVTKQYELDRAKTDFIATISHELRTPLTPIQGYLDLLFQPSIGGPLSENQLFFLQTIRQNVQVMSNLLNNVILLARIEMGNAKPEIQPVAVASAIEEALVSLRSQIEGKGLRLSVHVHDALPPLAADPHQLRIILVQIIDNACRYTEAGTITISAAHLAEFIQIDITDTGPGISYEDQQRLFTRFSRAGEQRGLVSTERGAGVGLAIARRLVELQGGSIHVNSQPGKGSTFSIRLRWMSSDYEPRHEPQSVDAAVAQE